MWDSRGEGEEEEKSSFGIPEHSSSLVLPCKPWGRRTGLAHWCNRTGNDVTGAQDC